MIVVENLVKTFHSRNLCKTAVNNISFTARDGEVFGLLGPNGAGKTTTLLTIATLLQADSGTVKVDNLDVVTDSRAVRNRIGFLTGDMHLTGNLTPKELLYFFGQLDHMEKEYIEKRISELSNDFDLTNYLDVPVAKLSSGVTQKVSIAVALLNEPNVIVFDEPTTNLDVMATKIVSDFIKKAKDQGKCVLLSTHILSEAQRLCDRVGIMYEGFLLSEGPLVELLEKHKCRDIEQLFFQLIDQENSNNV